MTAPLHIFRAGTYTDMHGQPVSISADDLAASAGAYDPAIHQAPIVVGHPKDNAPAFGWISTLSATADDLDGEPSQVDPDFAAAVSAGRYKTRSASFWPPTHPGNPRPGVWYLRHVGFLGGAAPAVKGLRGADLAAGEDVTTIELSAPDAAPTPEAPTMPDPAAPAVDLAARQAELETQAAALAAREQAIAEREAASAAQAEAIRRTEIASFCDGLADEARIRPADAPALVALLAALPDAPAVEFASADGAPASQAAWLRGWLAKLPPLVDLGEIATKGRAGTTTPEGAERYAHEYQRDPAIQAEFSSPETYAAFKSAEAAGRVNLSNRLTPIT